MTIRPERTRSRLMTSPAGAAHTPGDVLDHLHTRGVDPIELLNEIAEWLEPRLVAPTTADMLQTVAEALVHLDPAGFAGVRPAARRWVREPHRPAHPVVPDRD